MIQISQVKLPVEHNKKDLEHKIVKELELRHIFKDMPSFDYKIIRKSIDARKKPEIYYIYTLAADFKPNHEEIILKKCRNKNVSKYNPSIYISRTASDIEIEVANRIKEYNKNEIPGLAGIKKPAPVIIGEGPAGLFAGLILARAGLMPIIFERGDNVDNRVDKVENFWLTGSIDEETNVQYGEGGAGTFSDGKLNTLVKDKTGKNQFVLDTLVKFGAKENIAYDAKPHVGTDVLRTVVRNIREEIISLGGSVHHLCKMTDLVIEDGAVKAVIVENTSDKTIVSDNIDKIQGKLAKNQIAIKTDDVILALGHSARDTFEKLDMSGVEIIQKNFAIGIRIQHLQSVINDSQYGSDHSSKLPPAPYKVTNHTGNGRDVFSFCMCPGGYVVNASSKKGYTCVNGMSYSDRGSKCANSALIVAIDRNDFPDDSNLSGMRLQERIEKKAFEIGNGAIPIQLFGDFKNNKVTESFGTIEPMFKGETRFANLREIFPDSINEAIVESIEKFGYTIEGFDDNDAVLAAVESRTSSPIRIVRDGSLQSNIKGLYPCGEGAGYAGGIMSAAMDGIKVADAIIDKYIENIVNEC